jgi:hypothetical protein
MTDDERRDERAGGPPRAASPGGWDRTEMEIDDTGTEDDVPAETPRPGWDRTQMDIDDEGEGAAQDEAAEGRFEAAAGSAGWDRDEMEIDLGGDEEETVERVSGAAVVGDEIVVEDVTVVTEAPEATDATTQRRGWDESEMRIDEGADDTRRDVP